MLKGLVGSSELISLAPWDVVAADVEAGRLALLPWPAGSEPARAKGSAYGLVSRAGRTCRRPRQCSSSGCWNRTGASPPPEAQRQRASSRRSCQERFQSRPRLSRSRS